MLKDTAPSFRNGEIVVTRSSTLQSSCIALVLLATSSAAGAQEPIRIPAGQIRGHEIGSYARIRSGTKVDPLQRSVNLQLIVDESGNVEDAKPFYGPEMFFDQVIQAEIKRKFKPFEQNGVPVRVTFEDYVSILPPEQWSDKRAPFPEVKDWNTLKIHLKRTECMGSCPVYSLDVHGNGSIDFDGGYNVLIPGHHHGTIAKQSLENLVAVFRRANYLSLKNEYRWNVTDVPTYISSIEFDSVKKSVIDEVGAEVGMPDAATTMEEAIDRFASTDKWIKGNVQTGPSLIAEHWDFSSNSEVNRKIFANVVGFPELVHLWTAKAPPSLIMTRNGVSPLITAAGEGNYNLVKSFLTAQPDVDPATKTCALEAAAQSGKLMLVEYMIGKGADPSGPFCVDNLNVLMRAALSGKAEIVQEILNYKPDVNAQDSQLGFTALTVFLQRMPIEPDDEKIVRLLITAGSDVNIRDNNQKNTPLFYACSNGNAGAVRILIKAGANVNARNSAGQTVLMSCFAGPATLRPIIEAGADLTIKDNQGQTAAESARSYNNKEKADLLEAAEKAQAKLHR